MTPQRHRSALAAAAHAFLGSVATLPVWTHATERDPAPVLEEVTITARTLESGSGMAPAQQLSGPQLTQRQASTLGETLETLPGVANSSFGPNVGRPILRGMEGDRIRILHNSGGLVDVSGVSNDHAVPIDPLTTERIEILRGPAALFHGGNAMGGVVNVIDNRIARERTFDAAGGVIGKAEMRAGGAASERSQAAMVETGTDQFVLHVDAFDRSTQNLRVPKDMTCGPTGPSNGRRVCNSASNSQGAAMGGTWLFDRGYLGVSASDYQNRYGTVIAPDVSIDMQRRHQVMEGLMRDVGSFQEVKFQWGHTQYTHTELEGAVPGTRFDNAGYDWRVEGRQRALALPFGAVLDGAWSIQRDSNQLQALGEEKFLPSSRTHSTGLSTYQAVKTSWGQVNAGARVESVEVVSLEAMGPNAAQSRKFQPLNLSLGAVRNLRRGENQEGWQLTTQVSASQRAPKDYELFAFGQHVATAAFEMGQPHNEMEKGTQLDAGAEWTSGPHKWGLTVYASQYANYLSLQPTGEYRDSSGQVTGNVSDWPAYQFQGVRARFHGFESTAKIRLVGGQSAWLTPNSAHGAMDLELRADAVQARDVTHQQAMPRIAPLRLGADALWSRHAWTARVGFLHAAPQNQVPTGGVSTAGYTWWNAGLNYHTHQGPTHWMLFAKLDNLTNQRAYSSTSVLTQTLRDNAPPLAGRSLKVGAQVSF